MAMEYTTKLTKLPSTGRRKSSSSSQPSFVSRLKNSKYSKYFRAMKYAHEVAYHCLIIYCFYSLGLHRPLRDYSLLILSLILNYGFILIDFLVDEYKKLPRTEKSFRKSMLNFFIWLASSAMLFGIVLPFAPYFNLYAAVPLYFLAVGGSALLLYLNLKHGDEDEDEVDRCSNV